MPPVSRKLHDIIPPDVRARASKSGVSRLDWYAGRTLDGIDEPTDGAPDDLPPGEVERLRDLARKIEPGDPTEPTQGHGVMVKLRRLAHHVRLRGHRA